MHMSNEQNEISEAEIEEKKKERKREYMRQYQKKRKAQGKLPATKGIGLDKDVYDKVHFVSDMTGLSMQAIVSAHVRSGLSHINLPNDNNLE